MSGVYLKYPNNTLIAIENSTKINLPTIISLNKEVLPHSAPLNYRSIEGGFYLSFVNDKEINEYFKPQNLYKLKKYNLTPTLSPYSKKNREVYVPGISRNIYYLPKDKIVSEIKKNHNLDVLFINLFVSRGDTRYLVITTDSRASRDNLIKSTVKLFGSEFKPQPKLETRHQNQQHSPPTHNRGTVHPSNCNSWRTGPPSPPSSFYTIESAQSQNIALPKTSDWAGSRKLVTPQTINKSNLTVLTPRPRILNRTVSPQPAQVHTPQPPSTGQQPPAKSTASDLLSTPLPEPAATIPVQPSSPATASRPPTPATRTIPPLPGTITRPTPATTVSPTTIRPPTPATRTRPGHQQHTPSKPQQQDLLPQQPTLNTQGSLVHTLSVVSEALANGIEHPEVFQDFMNILLTQHGFATINLPKHALQMSRNIFIFKNPDKLRTSIPFSVLHRTPS